METLFKLLLVAGFIGCLCHAGHDDLIVRIAEEQHISYNQAVDLWELGYYVDDNGNEVVVDKYNE